MIVNDPVETRLKYEKEQEFIVEMYKWQVEIQQDINQCNDPIQYQALIDIQNGQW